eukprot:scaffold196_cov371-Prasinococcus_capsulatus_cf.AAC.14
MDRSEERCAVANELVAPGCIITRKAERSHDSTQRHGDEAERPTEWECGGQADAKGHVPCIALVEIVGQVVCAGESEPQCAEYTPQDGKPSEGVWRRRLQRSLH